MKEDKIKVYVLELIFVAVAFVFSFLSISAARYGLTLFLVAYYLITKIFISKNKKGSIYENKVNMLVMVLSLLYLVLLYISGLLFGYEENHSFSFLFLISYFVPALVSIFAVEEIRKTFLTYDGKYHFIFSYLGSVCVYFVIYRCITNFYVLHGLMAEIGFGLFSSVSCNMLYQYLSYRYGKKPPLIYSVCTTLYPFIFPFVPRVSLFAHSVLNLFYPYLIYFVLENSYSKDNGINNYRLRKKNAIETGIAVFISIMIVCLVSCKFHYGMIVIGSDSMKGTFDKGDAVVFKKYNNQSIHKGDIIVFKKDDLSIVHRIEEIRNINGLVRYYTKGDANRDMDDSYTLESDIEGVMLFHIPYIGKPTLWFHDIK